MSPRADGCTITHYFCFRIQLLSGPGLLCDFMLDSQRRLRLTMRAFCIRLLRPLTLIAMTVSFVSAQNLAQSPASPEAIDKYLHLPLAFERHGAGPKETWVARGQGYAIGVQRGKASIQASSKAGQTPVAFSLEFAGAKTPAAVPGAPLPGKVNYIHGNDPKNWQLGLSTYDRVIYPGLYPGVDLVYYGNQQEIEFDLAVKPGADPRGIRMKVRGGGKLSIDDSGDLRIGESEVRIALPKIYQEINGAKKAIPGRYTLRGRNEVGFEMAAWDRTRPLVIDPAIIGPGITLSTLLGGSTGNTFGEKIALDSLGNIYLTGYTSAADFITGSGQFQTGTNGPPDGFVTSVSAAGKLAYSTYFGGSGTDEFLGIAADANGNAWVTGSSNSTDFPLMNATQAVYGGGTDAVVVKLTSSGALAFSTYLGGSSIDVGEGIAVDGLNNAYVTGYTGGSFPTTPGVIQPAFQGGDDIFVAKYSSAGSVVYSTLLGGPSNDLGFGIAVDATGDAYVAGFTASAAFVPPNPPGGAQAVYAGGTDDAFVAKLNPTATALGYFTYLGGTNADFVDAIALDSTGNVFVAGYTGSAGIATPGAAQTVYAGGYDGFAAKLNSTGTTFNYITYLGGNRNEFLFGVAVDGGGNAYLTGSTESANLPTALPIQAALTDSRSLLQTTNSGTSWSGFDGNIPGAIFDISPDPIASGTIIVTTDQGIYRTTNGGTSWTQQFSGLFGSIFGSLFLGRSPVTPSTIYEVLNNGSTSISTDNGVTWTTKGMSVSPASGIVADGASAQTAYVFGGSGIYVTTNGGTSWTAANTGLPSHNVIAMAAGSDGSIYAAVVSSGLYKSTNKGASWTSINSGLPAPNFIPAHSLLVYPTAPSELVFSTDGLIYYSINGGASWSSAGFSGGIATAIAAASDQSIAYAATTAGIVYSFLSANGNWMPVGPPLTTSNISLLSVDPLNDAHVFAVTAVPTAAIVAKLNSTGSAFLYSTYLGGTGNTVGEGIATNGNGQAYVSGYTVGTGFPITAAHIPATSTSDAFAAIIADTAPSCFYAVNGYAVNPATATLTGASQSLILSVAAPNGCSWTAGSNQTWAPVSPTSSSGSGIVTALIGANTSGSTRTATLTIGGQQVTVTQSNSSCSYSLDQNPYFVVAAGGTITANLTTGAGCAWAVQNNAPFAVAINSGGSGTGSGAISLSVGASGDGNQRSLALPVGNINLNITQTGTCVYTPEPTSVNVPPASDLANSVNFTASAAYCSTSPVVLSNVPWLTVSGFSLGLNYTAAANTGAARTGIITIGSGGTFTVYQAAAGPPTIGTITNVGTTVNNMDAIAFNSSGTLYGATSGAGSLYTINPVTGVVTLVHALVSASNAALTYGVSGLAFQPGTGTLYGSTSPDSPNSPNSVVTINPATGQVIVFGPTGTGYPYTDIAFAPGGKLYGWLVGSATTISAATINPATGAGTSLGSPQTPIGLPDGGGLAINSSGVIYVAANGHAGGVCSPTVSCSGAFWTIDPFTGAPTTIGALSGGPGSAPTITALAFSPSGVLFGIEGGDGGATWNLITINTVSAGPITYTVSGNLTGTIGTTPLTNTPFLWTEVGITTGVTTSDPQTYANFATSGDINITGAGDATVTDTVGAYIDQTTGNGFAALLNATGTFGIGVTDPTDVDSWLLATSFGPITGSSGSVSTTPLNTSLGPLNVTAVSNLTFQAWAGPAFFTGEADLGSGVYYLQFPDNNLFGYYNFPASSILYHYDMGFEGFIPGTGSDIYLYDFATKHWWYTGAGLFPYLYDFTLGHWLFYFTDPKNAGHYSTNPRYFSDLTAGQIITM